MLQQMHISNVMHSQREAKDNTGGVANNN